MAHYNTILSQITALIPRHGFDYHADIHLQNKNSELSIGGVSLWQC